MYGVRIIRIGAIAVSACMLSTIFPLLICRTNFLNRRNASCSATRFAMRKVRRSGSETPFSSSANFAFTSGRWKYPESSFHIETLAGLTNSKIFPDNTPWAKMRPFSVSVSSVGSRPSMNRENICSRTIALGPSFSWKRSWMKQETVL